MGDYSDRRKIMLFDSEETGHHREYLLNVLRYAPSIADDCAIVAVVHPRVAADLSEESTDNLELAAIDSSVIDELHGIDGRLRRSLEEWAVVERYAHEREVDHCVLMSLNWFQFALGLPRARSACFTLTGILFFPYVRIGASGADTRSRISHFVRRLRKRWTLRWMLRNRRLRTIFVLNDPEATERLNRDLDPEERRFRTLPDPIPPLDSSARSDGADDEAGDAYRPAKNRTVFLFIGTISERKGILTALDAFRQLCPSDRERSALCVFGRLPGNVQERVRSSLRRLREDALLEVRTHFRFLSEPEFQRALRDCEYVLALHRRTEGSSGILGQAARAGRPIIGPRGGLMGELIRRYGLGATIDVSRPEAVAEAVRDALDGRVQLEEDGARRYVEERHPEEFAERILLASCQAGVECGTR